MDGIVDKEIEKDLKEVGLNVWIKKDDPDCLRKDVIYVKWGLPVVPRFACRIK